MFSNAFLSKTANDATKTALQASEDAKSGKGTHAQASKAHQDAAMANHQAGNITQARAHEKLASAHDEHSAPEQAAGEFAASLADHADKLSKKADMAMASGKVAPDETGNDGMRSAADLHDNAKEAHLKAALACKLAGKEADAKYHMGKAAEHASKAKGSSSDSASVDENAGHEPMDENTGEEGMQQQGPPQQQGAAPKKPPQKSPFGGGSGLAGRR